jgi:hypothetical protein
MNYAPFTGVEKKKIKSIIFKFAGCYADILKCILVCLHCAFIIRTMIEASVIYGVYGK